jgi:hypothetical protein
MKMQSLSYNHHLDSRQTFDLQPGLGSIPHFLGGQPQHSMNIVVLVVLKRANTDKRSNTSLAILVMDVKHHIIS